MPVFHGFMTGCSPFAKKSQLEPKNALNILKDCKVAVKMSKTHMSTEIESLMREADTFIKIGHHENIIAFLGVVDEDTEFCVVLELAQGDLLTELKRMRKSYDISQRFAISVCKQIASAMVHLASLGLVHRDVAARNVLLCNQNAKLSDFGLCCECNNEQHYFALTSRMLPIRWLALESITDNIFSEKSDVWSFGVLMYEVYSLGEEPYEGISVLNMKDYLQQGERLQRPHFANDSIYTLMTVCWHSEPGERPTFAKLYGTLDAVSEELGEEQYGYRPVI